MKRRKFIVMLICGAAITWSVSARAQQTLPVIGFLSTLSSGDMPWLPNSLRQALGEAGFIEGQNVAIEYRWAEGRYDRLPALAAELVGRKVDVIYAFSLPAALAAKAATSTIPIVFYIGADPVPFGPVQSFNRPGANITGVLA
jgi:putative tryptophan/tyrosine transport system substrate-binding protein